MRAREIKLPFGFVFVYNIFNVIEQFRRLLDFVHNHGRAVRLKEQRWVFHRALPHKRAIERNIVQVAIYLFEHGGLAHLPCACEYQNGLALGDALDDGFDMAG
ncbi:MAG: hypothetical protein FWB76_04095, partial [Oscillospiraceae bacterium]|nr:hypothetical protein [Oscillospiraceae bacterium]